VTSWQPCCSGEAERLPIVRRLPRSTAPSRATREDSHWHDYILFYEYSDGEHR